MEIIKWMETHRTTDLNNYKIDMVRHIERLNTQLIRNPIYLPPAMILTLQIFLLGGASTTADNFR